MKISRIDSVKIAKKRAAKTKQRERKKRNELKERKKRKIPNDLKLNGLFVNLEQQIEIKCSLNIYRIQLHMKKIFVYK